MYAQDSFFTLSVLGQIGLAVLSLCLAVGVLWAVVAFPGGRARRAVFAAILFWLFVWLSPQIFYSYYRMIIPGLPVQSVIQYPPTPSHTLRLISFGGDTSLSAHSQGLLFWFAVFAALRKKKHLRRDAAN